MTLRTHGSMVLLHKGGSDHARYAPAALGALEPLVMMIGDTVPGAAQTCPAAMAANGDLRGMGS